MSTVDVLGLDIGASSGRGVVGRFDGRKLSIEEICRFPNKPVSVLSNIYWDILSLLSEVENAMTGAKALGIDIRSAGIDTWGVDFGLLDNRGNLLGNPRSYRDDRTEGITDKAFGIIGKETIFSKTGMFPSRICTLFQLLAMKSGESSILSEARTLLFMPNLICYFLTGVISCETTLASTSLLYDPSTGRWIDEFLDRFGLPRILPEIANPGYIIGNITSGVMEYTGLHSIPVVSVASHDTASAIAAVPADDKKDIIYISSGTWSVVGTTVNKPITGIEALQGGFNNEMGYGGEIMFVKNITGLWILQECIREWSAEGYRTDYDHMDDWGAANDSDLYIDVDDAGFSQPGGMTNKVIANCGRLCGSTPDSREAIYLCIVNGLARKYMDAVRQIGDLTGKRYERIHIVGGGSKNRLLCLKTARLTGMDVLAGPYEATAIGNIMAQLAALGEIGTDEPWTQFIRSEAVYPA